MYTIKDAAKLLPLNENQIRRRLNFFHDSIKIIHGKRNRILIDESGLQTLKDIEFHERQGLTLQSIQELLMSREQLKAVSLLNSRYSNRVPLKDVKLLEAENIRLKVDIENKNECISTLSSVITEYLPKEAHNKLKSLLVAST